MKKTTRIAALLLALVMVFALAACGETPSAPSAQPSASPAVEESAAPATESPAADDEMENDVWADATYTEDTELGEGAKVLTVECTAGGKTVTFTIHTDAATVGEALKPLGLITGEDSEFGMYVKTVNGMAADYDADGYYWAFYADGEYAPTGVDSTDIAEGVTYALVREAA